MSGTNVCELCLPQACKEPGGGRLRSGPGPSPAWHGRFLVSHHVPTRADMVEETLKEAEQCPMLRTTRGDSVHGGGAGGTEEGG